MGNRVMNRLHFDAAGLLRLFHHRFEMSGKFPIRLGRLVARLGEDRFRSTFSIDHLPPNPYG